MSNTAVRSEYTVTVELTARIDSATLTLPAPANFTELEPAIRRWDATVSNLAYKLRFWPGVSIEGGIAVKQFDANGLCVRDGWILHLFDKHTYLNPNLIDPSAPKEA